ncbi:DUF6950 family protein [Rhizobium tropici]|uniref:DUF6950 domain-containing protein n=2 Tax=Rhizobium tropici TaxID=398 RepID=A0A6P1C8F6_RHITR|nr:hypothetical protein [Rhizobium tropici]MBB4242372.1 hypothetical protein [Rhizobium tropici]MBB5594015.1 hypothetical protein [Rhizobium tropici]NEV13348.1 hypothetical protein [Rhizobium tropici]TGE97032.1 hypothetical protein C9417_15485 [Rhizobium sp. SEMIA 4088]
MKLRDWLELPHRFRWGGRSGDDCLMFCASWVWHVTGRDPVEEFRGTYSSEDEAREILTAHGGMIALVDAVAMKAGIRRTDDPQTGDIGIIRAPSWLGGKLTEIGAIKFGPVWACLGPAGVVGKKAECLAAWSVPQ